MKNAKICVICSDTARCAASDRSFIAFSSVSKEVFCTIETREGYVVELWGRILCVVVYYKGILHTYSDVKKYCNKIVLSLINVKKIFSSHLFG